MAEFKREYRILVGNIDKRLSQSIERQQSVQRREFERKLAELKKAQIGQMKMQTDLHRKELVLLRKEFEDQIRRNRANFSQEIERLQQQLLYRNQSEQHFMTSEFLSRPSDSHNTRDNSTPIDAKESGTLHAGYASKSENSHNLLPHFEMILNRFKRELLVELERRDMRKGAYSTRSHEESDSNHYDNIPLIRSEPESQMKKSQFAEILNQQVPKAQAFISSQTQFENNQSKEIESLEGEDGFEENDFDSSQKEIFDMLNEIAQEKRNEKMEVEGSIRDSTKQISLGSRVAKKLGL